MSSLDSSVSSLDSSLSSLESSVSVVSEMLRLLDMGFKRNYALEDLAY